MQTRTTLVGFGCLSWGCLGVLVAASGCTEVGAGDANGSDASIGDASSSNDGRRDAETTTHEADAGFGSDGSSGDNTGELSVGLEPDAGSTEGALDSGSSHTTTDSDLDASVLDASFDSGSHDAALGPSIDADVSASSPVTTDASVATSDRITSNTGDLASEADSSLSDSSQPDPSSAPAGTTLPPVTLGSEGDAGTVVADAGVDSGDEGSGAGGKFAEFTFSQVHVTAAGFSLVNAGFGGYFFAMAPTGAEPAPVPEDLCTSVTIGNCTARTCPEDEEGDAGVAEGEQTFNITEFEAGGVEVTGLLIDPLVPEFKSVFELAGLETPEGELIGYNTPPSILQALWAAGDSAHIHVIANADVPEFNLDFELPNPVVPSLLTTIDTGSAFNPAWTNGGGPGDIMLSLSGSVGEQSRSIVCTVPPSDGGVSIDPALLAGLEGTGAVSLLTLHSVTGVQGDWVYSVSAEDLAPTTVITFSP